VDAEVVHQPELVKSANASHGLSTGTAGQIATIGVALVHRDGGSRSGALFALNTAVAGADREFRRPLPNGKPEPVSS
jgi:hypothetical protein